MGPINGGQQDTLFFKSLLLSSVTFLSFIYLIKKVHLVIAFLKCMVLYFTLLKPFFESLLFITLVCFFYLQNDCIVKGLESKG